MAIANSMEKITNSLDNMKAVISVFIDLKKAFDKIDHTILLQKLNHTLFTMYTCKCITAILYNIACYDLCPFIFIS